MPSAAAAAAQIEFFFDYGSPYSYLADALLPVLARRCGAEIVHRPFLLGGVFKDTGNKSPAAERVAPKAAYGMQVMRRTAAACGAEFRRNPHFPINTLMAMRLCIAAQQSDVFADFHAAVYPAFWARGLDMGDADVFARVLGRAGLDAAALSARAQSAEVKAKLRANTEEAVARGAFGAPTFFAGGEMYFGCDHLPFLERALRGAN